MEGSDTHPAVWEMLFAQTWRTNSPDFNTWLDDYVHCRYGAAIRPHGEEYRSFLIPHGIAFLKI